ncbi:MAG TPA: hypothetical protein DEW46_09480 [Verrucomicrobia bacterium]|jgi:hypothetical protein|nr:hypothetical protein [Verrucomicrobiota bacterium]
MSESPLPEYLPFDASKPVPLWYLCLVQAGREIGMEAWEICAIAEAGQLSALGDKDGIEAIDRLGTTLRGLGKAKLAQRLEQSYCQRILQHSPASSSEDLDLSSDLTIELEDWVAELPREGVDLFALQRLGALVRMAFHRFGLFLQVAGAHPDQVWSAWKLIGQPGARVPVFVYGFQNGCSRRWAGRRDKRRVEQQQTRLEREVHECLAQLIQRHAGACLSEDCAPAFFPVFCSAGEPVKTPAPCSDWAGA